MTAILTYILKWAFGLAVLYLPFALLLRKETFATLNRRLLLCIIIASALLPFIIVSYPVEIELPSQSHATATVNDTVTSYSAKPIATTASIKGIITPRNIFILYSAGVIASILFCAISLIKAIRSIKRGAIWVDRQKRMTGPFHATT